MKTRMKKQMEVHQINAKDSKGTREDAPNSLVNVLILERENLVEIGTPRKQQQTNSF